MKLQIDKGLLKKAARKNHLEQAKGRAEEEVQISERQRKQLMLGYSTEQVDMTTSYLQDAMNKRKGFIKQRAIDRAKIISLSKDIFSQYSRDSLAAKKFLQHKLNQLLVSTASRVIHEEETGEASSRLQSPASSQGSSRKTNKLEVSLEELGRILDLNREKALQRNLVSSVNLSVPFLEEKKFEPVNTRQPSRYLQSTVSTTRMAQSKRHQGSRQHSQDWGSQRSSTDQLIPSKPPSVQDFLRFAFTIQDYQATSASVPTKTD